MYKRMLCIFIICFSVCLLKQSIPFADRGRSPPLLKWYLPCSFSKGHTLTSVFCISSHFLLPAPPPAFTSPSGLLAEGGRIMRVWSKAAPLESAAPSAARVVEGGAALSSCLSASSRLLYWSSSLPLGGVCQATPPLSPSWAQMQLSRQQGGRLASATHSVCRETVEDSTTVFFPFLSPGEERGLFRWTAGLFC